jgi:hypothetical protein
MTCKDCTFCNEDLLVLKNSMMDARARGNYEVANGLEKALQRCLTLQDKLEPHNRAYLENVARIAKGNTWPTDAQTDLLIDAQQVIKTVKQNSEPYQEPRPQESGFRGQVNAAFHVQPTETDEPEATQPTSVFCSMLQAASGKGEQPHTVIERVIQTNPEDIVPREGGVVTMLERVVARRTNDEPEPIETRDLSTYRVPYGFSEMIEAAFPHGNRTTPEDKPHVVRGMGFAAMLEASRRGTE